MSVTLKEFDQLDDQDVEDTYRKTMKARAQRMQQAARPQFHNPEEMMAALSDEFERG